MLEIYLCNKTIVGDNPGLVGSSWTQTRMMCFFELGALHCRVKVQLQVSKHVEIPAN